jgi:hypothetical protein
MYKGKLGNLNRSIKCGGKRIKLDEIINSHPLETHKSLERPRISTMLLRRFKSMSGNMEKTHYANKNTYTKSYVNGQ